jgi:hypothetical protein
LYLREPTTTHFRGNYPFLVHQFQFEWQLFHFLGKLCGIQLSQTTVKLVEHFHRMLKADTMCHADQQWTKAIPLVLFGIHMTFKEDLQASVAELVYGGLLTLTAHPVASAHLIT